MTRTDKLARGLGALICVLLAATGCITINIPAPTPLPTPSPTALPTPSPAPSPTSLPQQDLELREKGEPLFSEPALFQFSVTLTGKAVDVVTREEVTSAKVTFITRTGTLTFGSRYELTIPSGSVVRVVVEAPGYKTLDVQMKPHVGRSTTLEMEIPIEKSEGEQDSL